MECATSRSKFSRRRSFLLVPVPTASPLLIDSAGKRAFVLFDVPLIPSSLQCTPPGTLTPYQCVYDHLCKYIVYDVVYYLISYNANNNWLIDHFFRSIMILYDDWFTHAPLII